VHRGWLLKSMASSSFSALDIAAFLGGIRRKKNVGQLAKTHYPSALQLVLWQGTGKGIDLIRA
jgi:hypothetical protein